MVLTERSHSAHQASHEHHNLQRADNFGAMEEYLDGAMKSSGNISKRFLEGCL